MPADNYTLVYTDGGVSVHLLDWLLSPNEPNAALCGRMPSPGLWHGTGSQDEEDRAYILRPCRLCLDARQRREDGEETR